jgi:hypothetical protein
MTGSLTVFGAQVQVGSEVGGGNAVNKRVACTIVAGLLSADLLMA